MTKTNKQYQILTGVERPDLVKLADEKIGQEWPEFMLHDPVAKGFVDLYEKLPQYQFVLVDQETGETVSLGNSIPLAFNDTADNLPDDGWDWAMTTGLDDLVHNCKPNLLCALQVVVCGDHRGQQISTQAVNAMKAIGRANNLSALIAPVRPNRKSDYPLTPIDQYITWTRDDGLPFDPWLRVHARLGARIIKPCPTAMRITGTVAEWEKWANMRFPDSGDYVVPGALVPIRIDLDNDTGAYIEPNVWMLHKLG